MKPDPIDVCLAFRDSRNNTTDTWRLPTQLLQERTSQSAEACMLAIQSAITHGLVEFFPHNQHGKLLRAGEELLEEEGLAVEG